MNRDDETFRKGQFILRMFRGNQRNMFAMYPLAQCGWVVETKQSVSVIDEQVELCQKILPENPSNASIARFDLSQFLNYGEQLIDHMRVCTQAFQNSERRLRVT